MIREHVESDGRLHLDDFGLSPDYLQILRRVMIVSCGTAYHAALYGKLLLENVTGLAVETDLGSEFRYRGPRIERDTLVVAVSQSGETADTLASVRLARQKRCKVLSICNVRGSTLARESDAVFFTDAGPEIGVASTKAYTAQLVAFVLLAAHMGQLREELDPTRAAELIAGLRAVPDAIHYVLDRKETIRAIADKHHDGPSSLYLGRKFNFPTALEGALKNKEISYQHAEGYAAGEMKHGPIALINEYMPVICLCTRTRDEVYEKMISNIREVEARHGRIIVVANDGDSRATAFADDVIFVPEVLEELSPIVNVVALQLLAYYAAQARGTDIDKPRNLAKSVTVE
jgi:glucosamine--fructose-6-phosphate aminotransferase (isomerizing)